MQARITPILKAPTRLTMPGLLLRLEGLGILAGTLALYAYLGHSWLVFVVCLLLPDLSAIGYLRGVRLGSVLYNLVHTTLFPLLVGVGGLVLASPLAVQVALIWLAHIGMDRAVGYGLKYSDTFGHTHLGEV